ncbi:MAG: hypothetical protein J6X58_07515 [Bacteroidales bacterium]|nr:hypothetical protein [Bacteroidales bacterium]
MPLKKDPIEDTDRFKAVIDDVEKEVDKMLKNKKRCHGFCHLYWAAKKEVLLKKYGIEWRTPAQMNPGVHFD